MMWLLMLVSLFNVYGFQPLTPRPEWLRWGEAVVECAGVEADLGALSWALADSIFDRGSVVMDQERLPAFYAYGVVVLDRELGTDSLIVSHELMHYAIEQSGRTAYHTRPEFERCGVELP